MTPEMTGYSAEDAQSMSTTDLLRILETERLTTREIRLIKAEIKTRVI